MQRSFVRASSEEEVAWGHQACLPKRTDCDVRPRLAGCRVEAGRVHLQLGQVAEGVEQLEVSAGPPLLPK